MWSQLKKAPGVTWKVLGAAGSCFSAPNGISEGRTEINLNPSQRWAGVEDTRKRWQEDMARGHVVSLWSSPLGTEPGPIMAKASSCAEATRRPENVLQGHVQAGMPQPSGIFMQRNVLPTQELHPRGATEP